MLRGPVGPVGLKAYAASLAGATKDRSHRLSDQPIGGGAGEARAGYRGRGQRCAAKKFIVDSCDCSLPNFPRRLSTPSPGWVGKGEVPIVGRRSCGRQRGACA